MFLQVGAAGKYAVSSCRDVVFDRPAINGVAEPVQLVDPLFCHYRVDHAVQGGHDTVAARRSRGVGQCRGADGHVCGARPLFRGREAKAVLREVEINRVWCVASEILICCCVELGVQFKSHRYASHLVAGHISLHISDGCFEERQIWLVQCGLDGEPEQVVEIVGVIDHGGEIFV
ncbi:hypothetical protein OGAPHI_000608 [Ogataea philodendri]|uniref:Uncharacterized protein n=1 Tax=Ogataea philodendri TaxID=1378263 RepID=A0A9P8PFH2_9ASCO|nr:uncharacterized protein OGAPHI_000608 [Ogataea philodendri]KAH3670897.1 hypothetical protein OGAPHI_000608 [Ogataea philodendri]